MPRANTTCKQYQQFVHNTRVAWSTVQYEEKAMPVQYQHALRQCPVTWSTVRGKGHARTVATCPKRQCPVPTLLVSSTRTEATCPKAMSGANTTCKQYQQFVHNTRVAWSTVQYEEKAMPVQYQHALRQCPVTWSTVRGKGHARTVATCPKRQCPVPTLLQ